MEVCVGFYVLGIEARTVTTVHRTEPEAGGLSDQVPC